MKLYNIIQIPGNASEKEATAREFRDFFEKTGVLDYFVNFTAKTFEDFKDNKQLDATEVM